MTRPDKHAARFGKAVHQWADTHLANWVACTVCGFTAPRTLAKLAGHGDDHRYPEDR